MSKLRDKIFHYNTGIRAPDYYPQVVISVSEEECMPGSRLERHRAELIVRVDYSVNPSDRHEVAKASKNAEDNLLYTFYSDLIGHVYALRSALHARDLKGAMEIADIILEEVRP